MSMPPLFQLYTSGIYLILNEGSHVSHLEIPTHTVSPELTESHLIVFKPLETRLSGYTFCIYYILLLFTSNYCSFFCMTPLRLYRLESYANSVPVKESELNAALNDIGIPQTPLKIPYTLPSKQLLFLYTKATVDLSKIPPSRPSLFIMQSHHLTHGSAGDNPRHRPPCARFRGSSPYLCRPLL